MTDLVEPLPRSVLAKPLLAASVAIYSTVALAAFEGTAVAAALPQMLTDLGRISLLPWVITGYLFASGLATVVAGSLIDRFGTRTVFRAAVVIFGLSGTAAGFVTSMEAMVGVRLIQGVGSGMVFSAAIAAVSLVYPDHLVGRAYAANSNVWAVMAAAAPALAALALTFLSWRWIFFVNAPLATMAFLAGWKVMPGPVDGSDRSPIDWRGAVLLGVFTITLTLGVDQPGWMTLAWWAASGVALIGYRLHARRHRRPVLLPEHVIHNPYAAIGAITMVLIVAGFASNTYLTLYVSAGQGKAETFTAWTVFFFIAGWTTGANVSSRLLDRLSGLEVMEWGAWTSVPALAVTTVLVWFDAPIGLVLAGLMLIGAGIGMVTNAGLTTLRIFTVPSAIGRVTSAHQFVRNQGFTLGSALGGAILLFVLGRRLDSVEAVQRLLSGDGTVHDESIAAAVRSGYAWSLMAATVVSLAVLPGVRSMRRYVERRGT